MGAIADLWKSERGLVAISLILACTVLAAMGRMSISEWRDYTLYIYGMYAASKTVTGGIQIWKDPKTMKAGTDSDPDKTPAGGTP